MKIKHRPYLYLFYVGEFSSFETTIIPLIIIIIIMWGRCTTLFTTRAMNVIF